MRTKEKHAAYMREYSRKNAERINAQRRRRYDPRKNKNSMLKRYGINIEDYERIWKEQSGKCPICGIDLKEVWQVDLDHCHTTNKVRGILCNPCNLMIGHAKDSSERLKKGAEYLQQYG